MKNESVPQLRGVEALRYLWRQLTSMKTALILLLLLGIASIPGSLIPQRTQNPMAVQAKFQSSPSLAQWMDRLSLFDVYGSPWFSAIYILLFISLIGCVLPRSFEHYRAMRALPPKTPKHLEKMEHHRIVDGDVERAEEWLRRAHFRIRKEEGSVSAEKGYVRESGNLLFHLSLILILVGVSIGALFGMRADAIVNEGERFINTATSYDSVSYGRLTDESSLSPFVIQAQKFTASYDELTNRPQDYQLDVSVQESPGAQSRNKSLKVNEPLTFGATRVYLQANGYSPLVTVRDTSGAIVYSGAIPFLPQDGNLRSTGAIKVPDLTPQVGFIGVFLPTASQDAQGSGISIFPLALDPKLLLSIWSGDLGLGSGVPQSVYRLDTSKMKKEGLISLKVGDSYDFEFGTITFDRVIPWVNLQIVRDPGKSYALAGGVLALIGLLPSLFVRRRRIWVRRQGQMVEIAALAKNAAPGLVDEVEMLTAYVRGVK